MSAFFRGPFFVAVEDLSVTALDEASRQALALMVEAARVHDAEVQTDLLEAVALEYLEALDPTSLGYLLATVRQVPMAELFGLGGVLVVLALMRRWSAGG